MAKEIKVIIGADTKPLKAGLADAQRDLKGFGSFATGLVAGFGVGVFQAASSAISGFFAGAQQEALESQRAINSIRQSLESAGRTDLFSGLIKKANELQQQFKFLDNDDITASFQRLIQFGGLTEDQITRLLPVIIDLNAKQRLAGEVNKSLAATAEQVIKGIEGQGRELKLYGIEVTAANSVTENLGIILDQLGGKVKGAGDAFANSLEGQMAATTQRARDLQEELGNKLLPLKAGLLQFANEVADGFGLMIDRLQLGASAFSALQNVKVRVSFVQDEANKKFDVIKDLPLADLTTELLQYQAALKRTNDAVAANKSGEAAIKQWKLETEVVSAVITKLKEQIRLRSDSSTIGTHIKAVTEEDKKAVDAIKVRIAALKELIAAQVDVSKNKLELKGLDIKLLLRDAKEKGFTEEEIKKLIFAKFPDFDGTGLTLSKPVDVSVPIKVDIQQSVTGGSSSELEAGIQRTTDRIQKAGQEAGAKLSAKLQEPLDALNAQIQFQVANSLGDAIGDAFSGGNPVASFINVIAAALQQLGKALIAYGIAVKLSLEALAGVNPFLAIAAGAAAIAAGSVLKKQVNTVPQLAEGGIVSKATLAIIGERGPEVVVPLSKFNNLLGKNNSNGLQVQFIETKRRGEDMYEVWKIMNAKNNRLR